MCLRSCDIERYGDKKNTLPDILERREMGSREITCCGGRMFFQSRHRSSLPTSNFRLSTTSALLHNSDTSSTSLQHEDILPQALTSKIPRVRTPRFPRRITCGLWGCANSATHTQRTMCQQIRSWGAAALRLVQMTCLASLPMTPGKATVYGPVSE
jgi:hypothetical protein